MSGRFHFTDELASDLFDEDHGRQGITIGDKLLVDWAREGYREGFSYVQGEFVRWDMETPGADSWPDVVARWRQVEPPTAYALYEALPSTHTERSFKMMASHAPQLRERIPEFLKWRKYGFMMAWRHVGRRYAEDRETLAEHQATVDRHRAEAEEQMSTFFAEAVGKS